MIVPMKKVSLLVMETQKEQALRDLRKLGLMQIDIQEGTGEKIGQLRAQIAQMESAIYTLADVTGKKKQQKETDVAEAFAICEEVAALSAERTACQSEIFSCKVQLERLTAWGETDPEELAALERSGIRLIPCEIPTAEYDALGEELVTVVLARGKRTVRCVAVWTGENGADVPSNLEAWRLDLGEHSTAWMQARIEELTHRVLAIDERLQECGAYQNSLKQALKSLNKDLELTTYITGMTNEELSEAADGGPAISYLTGYVPEEDMGQLKAAAREHSWGLAYDDPTLEDDVPTKLKNNRFVSLIYPLTDFLGTVPGYFEYDISGWFLGFILIFFGIIFGDGGYGLIILAAALGLIAVSRIRKKPVSPMILLVALFGIATLVWGILTCSWFGMSVERIPQFLQRISLPIFSNAYADTLWYPFWTNGTAGLTKDQNLQIFCFTLGLIQMIVAHFKVAGRYRKSLRMIGEIGSILQLIGMYYVVLAVVVNGQVFGLMMKINGIPVGLAAIGLVAVGFILSFVFSNYEGSVLKSVLESMKNIVSVLLGVVNVFSDIVSYIRLWAVGLAGAAIAATVNTMAGEILGGFLFMIIALVLLIFGHGLNMILNVLSLMVHGIRLNTLEFSTHMGMAWSGHKFEPFEE